MNFFKAQDDARRRTKWLVFYFILAIAGIITSVYGVVYIVLLFSGGAVSLWMPGVFVLTASATVGVISAGSLFKTIQFHGGVRVVALDIGASNIESHSSVIQQRRLRNVL